MKESMENKNYFCLNGQKIEIPEDKLEEIRNALLGSETMRLGTKKIGEIAKLGEYEFIVLEHSKDTTALILKDLFVEKTEFGSCNDYRGSKVQKICREFAQKLEAVVGEENLVEHEVDLTSDDGLKDYGTIREKASMLTANLYRRYVDVLDIDRIQKWWWLATPYSTPRHEDSECVKCVSPRGSSTMALSTSTAAASACVRFVS